MCSSIFYRAAKKNRFANSIFLRGKFPLAYFAHFEIGEFWIYPCDFFKWWLPFFVIAFYWQISSRCFGCLSYQCLWYFCSHVKTGGDGSSALADISCVIPDFRWICPLLCCTTYLYIPTFRAILHHFESGVDRDVDWFMYRFVSLPTCFGEAVSLCFFVWFWSQTQGNESYFFIFLFSLCLWTYIAVWMIRFLCLFFHFSLLFSSSIPFLPHTLSFLPR